MDEVGKMWRGVADNLKNTGDSKNPTKDIPKRFSDLRSLTLLDDAFLEQAGVTEGSDRDAVVRCVRRFLQNEENLAVLNAHKLINDPIYGTISLHPLAVLIMNTPQFQRLHYIKQLSPMIYVYPSGGYSRFEHSVGVYHLAGKLVNILKDQQPELGITAIDVMCVQLAGLCHDLGHGPFSHLFDRTIIPKLDESSTWTHEDASTKMLDSIYENKEQQITAWGICKNDIEFIKSLIKGQENPEETGRDEHKSFLYEIVSNELSGMDVDKWDYLVRDSYHLGIKCGFDPDRLMYHMRVMKIEKVSAVEGGDKDQAVEGGDKDQAVEGGDKDQAVEGGDKDQAMEGGDKDPAVEGGGKDPAVEGGDKDQAVEGGDKDQAVEGGDKDQAVEGGDKDQTVEGDHKAHICVRRKEHDSVYSMFHTRYELYRKAYQHPVVNGVELMVAEAIVEAGKDSKEGTHLKIDGKEGQSKTLLECLGDMDAYTNLHDGIFFKILENKEGTWNNSKKLLVRIQERDLWKCVGQAVIPSSSSEERDKSDKVSATTATAETTSTTPTTTTTTATSATTTPATTTITNTTTPVTKEHLCDMIAAKTSQALKRKLSSPDLEFKCKVNTRNFGKKDKNPLEEIGFYDKEDPNTASLITDEDARSAILPKEFQQSILFVYCTSEREKLEGKEKEVCETVKGILEDKEYRLKVLSS